MAVASSIGYSIVEGRKRVNFFNVQRLAFVYFSNSDIYPEMSDQKLEASAGEFWTAVVTCKPLWRLATWYRYLIFAGFYFGLRYFDEKFGTHGQIIILGVLAIMLAFGVLILFMQSVMRDADTAVARDLRSVPTDRALEDLFKGMLTFLCLSAHFLITYSQGGA